MKISNSFKPITSIFTLFYNAVYMNSKTLRSRLKLLCSVENIAFSFTLFLLQENRILLQEYHTQSSAIQTHT